MGSARTRLLPRFDSGTNHCPTGSLRSSKLFAIVTGERAGCEAGDCEDQAGENRFDFFDRGWNVIYLSTP
jgi:hypothetical protein